MVADVLMLSLFVHISMLLLQLGFLLTSVWAYTLQSSSLALYLGQSEVLAFVFFSHSIVDVLVLSVFHCIPWLLL